MSSGFVALKQSSRARSVAWVKRARRLMRPQRVAALLAGVLENARHPGGAEGFEELLPLARVRSPARHAHLLAQVGQLRVRRATGGERGELRAVQRRARGEAVALEDQRLRVQLEAVVEVARAGLEHRERDLAGLLDFRVRGRQRGDRRRSAGARHEEAAAETEQRQCGGSAEETAARRRGGHASRLGGRFIELEFLSERR